MTTIGPSQPPLEEEPPPAPAPRRLSPLTPVARAPIVTVAVLGGSWRQLLDEGGLGRTGLVLIGVLAVGAAYGAVSWLRTTYWIHGDELRIDTGVVVRQSRRIRIDRLQGVDILQPLVARLLGLAELRLDTAGGDREGRLAFLPHGEAVAVRQDLLARRDHLAAGPDAAGAPRKQHGPVAERVLARLDLGRLLVSVALSTEAALAVLAAAVTVALAIATGEAVVAGVLLPGLLALGVSVARKLTAYYGFTLAESAAGLHVRRGLTALSSQTIDPARIQGVVVREPLLWRRLGWARLEVAVAGGLSLDPDRAEASSTVLPVAPRAEVLMLAAHVLGGHDPDTVALTAAPRRAAWVAPLTWWNLALGQDAGLTVSRRGWWSRRTDAVPHARVQSLRVVQGPVQRLLRLADVYVDSPPGPVQVHGPHCEPPVARSFVDEAVARARTARRPGRPGQTEGTTPPAPLSSQ